jgi:uncharacterized membrane protein
MANKNDVLVVAYYQNIPTAGGVAQQLMDWDEADEDIKLGAVAVLGYDPRTDELKANEVGQRNTRKGALWGTAIGATVGILTGGIALIPGLIIGAGTGAALGAIDHKDVAMSDEQAAAMKEKLRHGAGAVAVMCDDFEVDATKAFLANLGGEVEGFVLPEATKEAVTAAAVVQQEAMSAVDEAVSEEAGKDAAAHVAAVSSLSTEDAEKLRAEGIDKASKLLAQGATPAGRKELAEATGLSEAAILEAVKQLDLMRVKGVGVKNSALLLAAGVETVPDLARRNGANLTQKLADVNASAKICEELPTEEMVAGWVAQAQALGRIITY